MKLLIIADAESDLVRVLESCGAEITVTAFDDALTADLTPYDAYCILASGRVLDARLRTRLEDELDGGKKVFTEALGSFGDIYSAEPEQTTRSRLVYLAPLDGEGVEGLETGDLLDDECNLSMQPWLETPDMRQILVYREHIVAHTHINSDRAGILADSKKGLWLCGERLMMTSFRLHDFNKARFAPRLAWQKLISYIARWLTGSKPSYFPENVVRYGPAGTESDELSDQSAFELRRKEAVKRGVEWLERFLVDGGRGGIEEGLRHNIHPDGTQERLTSVRTDCTGEASGAFRFFALLGGGDDCREIARNLESFVYGPMLVKAGLCRGMLRWTDTGWGVCYQDDAARAMLPGLYSCALLGENERLPGICSALDFLVSTTAKDGCRESRTDRVNLDESRIRGLSEAEHGLASAHYNAYYHAALLLAYQCSGAARYLETARRGLETLMGLYPDTKREQSETEEECRLILPLSLLYETTREEAHRAMLYRVADDLQKRAHPFGGYLEWDTGYKASCSRESTGECSILSENGDPVADLLYSCNWLPIGFAFAYRATGDERFKLLWRGISSFFIRTQVISGDPLTNGSWCRAFDMELREAYANPHDLGWAAYSSESGWTNAEILMGMMIMDIFEKTEK